jgi:hypothetical protein
VRKKEKSAQRSPMEKWAVEDRVDNPQEENASKLGADSVNEAGIFSPDRLRLSQNFAEDVGVKKVVGTVPVKKPNKQLFFRAHSNQAYRLPTATLEDQVDREIYLLAPELRSELASELPPILLVTCVDLDGNVFLFPAKVPDSSGRDNQWWQSARDAIERAQTAWVRMQAKTSLGAYEIMEATDNLGDPVWPDVSFEEILTIAFRDRYVDSLEHPLVKKLRGRR